MPSVVCKHCGQPLPTIRLGVRLTPLKARIFDLIRRAGPDGIAGEDLFALTLAARRAQRSTLKAHVWQINDAIEGTGYRIHGRADRYRLKADHGKDETRWQAFQTATRSRHARRDS